MRRSEPPRCVFDTNTLISAAIRPHSIPQNAITLLVERGGILLFSEESFLEIEEVISRPKIERYLSPSEQAEALLLYCDYGVFVEPKTHIPFPEDPKDEKILAVAVEGRADFLVTGDADLRALGRVGGTPILTAREFIEELS